MQHLDEATIHAWLDGELPPDDVAALEGHAASCDACAALVAEARGLMAASSRILGALDDVPSGVIPAALRSPEVPRPAPVSPVAIPEARPGSAIPCPTPARRPFYRHPQFAAAAAVVLMAVGTWTVMQRARGVALTEAVPVIARDAAPDVQRMDSAALDAVRPAAPAPVPSRRDAPPQPATAGNSGKGSASSAGPARIAAPRPAALAESDVATRREATANEARTRDVAAAPPPAAAVPSSDSARAAARTAPTDEQKRLMLPPDSVVARERVRLQGEVRAQAQVPPPVPTGARGSELGQVVVTGAAQASALKSSSTAGCYLVGQTPDALEHDVPERLELTDAPGPTIGDRPWRQVRVSGGDPPTGTWFWSVRSDGGVQLARIDGATVRYEVPVTGPAAREVRAVQQRCPPR